MKILRLLPILLLLACSRVDASGLLFLKSTSSTVSFRMVDSSDHRTGKTGLSPAVSLLKSGVSSTCLGTVSEVDAINFPGIYRLVLAAEDTDTTGELYIYVAASGADIYSESLGTVLENLPGTLSETFMADNMAQVSDIEAGSGFVDIKNVVDKFGSMITASGEAYTYTADATKNSPVTSASTLWSYEFTGNEGSGSAGLLGYSLLGMIDSGPSWTEASLAKAPSGSGGGVLSQTAPSSSFTATPLTGVLPLAVQFSDGSTNGPMLWVWDFGDGTTSPLPDPIHTYTSAGSYNVKLTVSNTGGASTYTRLTYIVVITPLVSNFTATKAPRNPYQITFRDVSTGTPTAWSWDFGDGTTSTSQNPTHTFTRALPYTVTLTTTKTGTSNTIVKILTVIP
jgi:PKD repeat protein